MHGRTCFFFGGSNKKEYIRALSTQIDPVELEVKDINIVIIGCGDHSLIDFYAQETNAKYPIYADPSQKLFKAFDLNKTISLGERPQYMSVDFWGGLKMFLGNMFKIGTRTFKVGDVKQVGGE